MRCAAAIFLLATFCFAQDKPQPAPASLAGAPLVTLERQLLGAEKSQNWNFVDSSLAPDFQYIAGDGRFYTKPEIMAEMKSIQVERYTGENFRASLLRDEIGVVTYEITSSGTAKGQPFTFRAVMSSTWRRQKDHWQMVFHTATPLPEPLVSAVELEGLEQDFFAREGSGDVEWLKQVVADDAVIVLGNGERFNKARFIEDVARSLHPIGRVADMKAQPLGPAAGTITSQLEFHPYRDIVETMTSTTVWKRGASGWQVLSRQYSSVKKP